MTSEHERSGVPSRTPSCDATPRPLVGTLAGLFTADDYPAYSLDHNEQGAVNVRLDVNALGRVSHCTILESSGHVTLDRATCSIITRRARFAAARNSCAASVDSTFSQNIRWQIAD